MPHLVLRNYLVVKCQATAGELHFANSIANSKRFDEKCSGYFTSKRHETQQERREIYLLHKLNYISYLCAELTELTPYYYVGSIDIVFTFVQEEIQPNRNAKPGLGVERVKAMAFYFFEVTS